MHTYCFVKKEGRKEGRKERKRERERAVGADNAAGKRKARLEGNPLAGGTDCC